MTRYRHQSATFRTSACGLFTSCQRPAVRYRSGYHPNNNLLGQVTFVLAVAASSAVIWSFFISHVTQDVRPAVDNQAEVR